MCAQFRVIAQYLIDVFGHFFIYTAESPGVPSGIDLQRLNTAVAVRIEPLFDSTEPDRFGPSVGKCPQTLGLLFNALLQRFARFSSQKGGYDCIAEPGLSFAVNRLVGHAFFSFLLRFIIRYARSVR